MRDPGRTARGGGSPLGSRARAAALFLMLLLPVGTAGYRTNERLGWLDSLYMDLLVVLGRRENLARLEKLALGDG